MNPLQQSLDLAESELTRLHQATVAASAILNGRQQVILEVEQQIGELEQRRETLTAEVEAAQESARKCIADAQAEASRCVNDARTQAKAILDDALARVENARNHILGEES